jgi:hypothetical protein
MSSTPPPARAAPLAPRRRRLWPWILLGVAVVLLGGCAATAFAVYQVVNDDDFLNFEFDFDRHAITREQFGAIELGTPRKAVIDELGKKPLDLPRSSCILYDRAGGALFLDHYTFCFDEAGNLVSKDAARMTPPMRSQRPDMGPGERIGS